MLSRRTTVKRGSRDEAEKPFWISFADLMTALMVLFLVSLSVALVRAQDETTKARQAQERAEQARKDAEQARKALAEALAELERRERERDTRREQRLADISSCHGDLEQLISEFNGSAVDGVRFDRARHVIDFGSRAQFEVNKHDLKLDQAITLRSFTTGFLSVLNKNDSICRKWLKRVVVEGFSDKTGSYLHNLNLSLNRSQRVMCVLLGGEYSAQKRAIEPVSGEDALQIKQLFLLGGYSSNSLKTTDEESRRIELRIEFYQVDEERAPSATVDSAAGPCRIGAS
jgi:outer membrane protein OmpA-like peptidoglycan-associated protein